MHRRGFLRGIAAAAVQLALPAPKIAGLLLGEQAAQRWAWAGTSVRPLETALTTSVRTLETALTNAQEVYSQLISITVYVREAAMSFALRVAADEPGDV